MKKILLIIFLISALLLAGCSSSGSDDKSSTKGSSKNKVLTIEINSEGFSPNPLIVGQGDTVTWINKDATEHWTASAMHPTHTVYPGSDINKCGTSEEKNIFDSCKGLAQDEEWSFTFNEKGEWKYHDHLNPKLFGKVIVE